VKAEVKFEADVEEIVVSEAAFDSFIEHQRKAIQEAGKAISTLLPEDFKEHGETAFKEVIESYRTLFNATIDEIIRAMEKVKILPPNGVEKVEKNEEEAVPVP
jgi:hypothetical protein